jgi:hypothetical protein
MNCKHIWHGNWPCGICIRDRKIEELEKQLKEALEKLKEK